MSFLHGVETFESSTGGVVVRGVRSSVIGIIGTAPVQHCQAQSVDVDEETLSDVSDAAKFGPNIEGYTLPRALSVLRLEGAKFVIAINVFDPAVHKTDVAADDLAITDGVLALAHGDLVSLTVKAAGGAGAALVEGTDYTVDRVKGVITVVEDGALDAAAEANVAYSYGDPSAITPTEIIGGVSAGGDRIGLQAFLNSAAKRGYDPKLLIAPGYSTQASVVAAMAALTPALKLRALAAVDAPVGTTVEEAIEGRGPSGAINFNVSDQRLVLCAPHVKVFDSATGQAELVGMSAIYGGVLARADQEQGFWRSPSNIVSRAILGLEFPISASLKDPAADCQMLNANGITTVYNAFGTGYRIWGNRSSAFPADASVASFVTQRRIADSIHQALENAIFPHIDKPITGSIISDVLQAGNAYFRTLATRGALAPGSHVKFVPEKNPSSELEKGKITWTLVFVGSPPFEKGELDSVTDTSLLANIKVA